MKSKNSFHFFPQNQWLDSFFRWDAGWYYVLVNEGYSYIPGQQSNVAFFPLYPLLVKGLVTITGLNTPIAGFLVSNICLIFALFFTYKIAAIYLQEEFCTRVLVLILTFPVSFFFSSLYTESLYLLTISASFYFFYKENYIAAGIWGFLASLTRLATGVLLIVAFAIDLLIKYWKERKLKISVISLLFVPCGLLSYMYFLYSKFGDPWLFSTGSKRMGQNFKVNSFLYTISEGLRQP